MKFNDKTLFAMVGSVPTGAVSYEPQTLTDEQKWQARENIGATDEVLETVLYTPQELDELEKEQARENIGAVTGAEVEAIVAAKLSNITNAEKEAY